MSEINLDLLRVFCIVAETGKIYKAAESLYISQPAVTQSIKKLEDTLGGALFYRTPKGVVLTEQGKRLYSFIKPSIDVLENAPKKFSQYINLEEGKIRIKSGTTIGDIILFDSLTEFIKDYPNIEIDVSSGRSRDAIEEVSNGKIDMAIFTLPCDNEKDNVEIIKYKPLEIVFYSSQEYLGQNNIDINNINDVCSSSLILPAKGSNTGNEVYKFFEDKNIKIREQYVIQSNNSRRHIVENGFGIGIGLKSTIDRKKFVVSNIKLPILNVGIAIQNKDIASSATLKLLEYILK